MNDNNDFIDLNDIPTDMIDRIEIYKGIVPAKLGGSAVGGAVNIVLKEYPAKYLDVGYSIKSFNTHQFNTVFKRNDQKSGLEYGLGAVLSHSDNSYTMESPFRKGQMSYRPNYSYEVLYLQNETKYKNTAYWLRMTSEEKGNPSSPILLQRCMLQKNFEPLVCCTQCPVSAVMIW